MVKKGNKMSENWLWKRRLKQDGNAEEKRDLSNKSRDEKGKRVSFVNGIWGCMTRVWNWLSVVFFNRVVIGWKGARGYLLFEPVWPTTATRSVVTLNEKQGSKSIKKVLHSLHRELWLWLRLYCTRVKLVIVKSSLFNTNHNSLSGSIAISFTTGLGHLDIKSIVIGYHGRHPLPQPTVYYAF